MRGVAERVEAMAREPLVAARIEFIVALWAVQHQLNRVN